jgi:hypothetical protein
MTKSQVCLTIESNLIELVRLRQKVDDSFILSNLVEEFLKDYFKEDLNDPYLDKKKLDVEEFEIKRRLAIIKAQKETIERVNTERSNELKDYWKQYPGMKRKDALIIKYEENDDNSKKNN